MNEEEKEQGRIKIMDFVLAEYEKGNIVVFGIEGPQTTSMENFLNQPIDGMLYDLNRSEEVVLTFIADPKWVNDFAVAKVIRALQAKIDDLIAPVIDTTARREQSERDINFQEKHGE